MSLKLTHMFLSLSLTHSCTINLVPLVSESSLRENGSLLLNKTGNIYNLIYICECQLANCGQPLKSQQHVPLPTNQNYNNKLKLTQSETDRHSDGNKHRQSSRHGDRQTDGDCALDKETLRQTDGDRALDKETLRQTDGDRERGRLSD